MTVSHTPATPTALDAASLGRARAHDRSAGRWCQACGVHGSHHTERHDEFAAVHPSTLPDVAVPEPGTKPRGACAFCGNEYALYRVGEVGFHKEGWVWGHGPEDNACPGSWQSPHITAEDLAQHVARVRADREN